MPTLLWPHNLQPLSLPCRDHPKPRLLPRTEIMPLPLPGRKNPRCSGKCETSEEGLRLPRRPGIRPRRILCHWIGLVHVPYRHTFNITTGIYQIGIARPVASALLIWDVFVNIFLTAVFVRHCKPYMVKGLRGTCLYPAIKGLLKKITHRHRKKLLAGGNVAIPISQDALIRVIRKAFWVNFIFVTRIS